MRQLYANLVFYPTLWWNMFLGRVLRVRNWWDEVDEHVVIGAYPFASDVPGLSELGIQAVVNTCSEYEGPIVEYRKYGIEQLRIPTIDFSHPTLESVERAVDFVEDKSRMENVFIFIAKRDGHEAPPLLPAG